MPGHLGDHLTACGGSRGARRRGGLQTTSHPACGWTWRFPTPFTLVYRCSEILEKTATSRHFWGRSACLPRGTARSASLLAVSISALRCLRRGDQETLLRRKPKTAISTSADCSLSPLAHHRTRPARVGERASADSKASSRMPVSRCDCYPPTLVFEPCQFPLWRGLPTSPCRLTGGLQSRFPYLPGLWRH